MTVAHRHDLAQGFELQRLGIGPEDARRSRLIAGQAIARLDRKTAVALGFGEGAKALERRLTKAQSGAFLVAKDIAGNPGFAARRDSSMAVRHDFGGVALTVSGETGDVWQDVQTRATGSPYRWATVAADKSFGHTWLSAGLSRLDEKHTLLGGRMIGALDGGGASSMFLDAEARHDFGDGFAAGLTARRGWTSYAGGRLQTSAFAFDASKSGLIGPNDRLGFRLSQPLRVDKGGLGLTVPVSYDYSTGIATSGWQVYSLTPSGREVDAELSYGSSLLDGNAWFGGNLFVRRQPGHIATVDNDYGAAIRFTLGF
jgi:hypothetical protein